MSNLIYPSIQLSSAAKAMDQNVEGPDTGSDALFYHVGKELDNTHPVSCLAEPAHHNIVIYNADIPMQLGAPLCQRFSHQNLLRIAAEAIEKYVQSEGGRRQSNPRHDFQLIKCFFGPPTLTKPVHNLLDLLKAAGSAKRSDQYVICRGGRRATDIRHGGHQASGWLNFPFEAVTLHDWRVTVGGGWTILLEHPVQDAPCLLDPPCGAKPRDQCRVGSRIGTKSTFLCHRDDLVCQVEFFRAAGVQLHQDVVGDQIRLDSRGDHLLEHCLGFLVAAGRREGVDHGAVAEHVGFAFRPFHFSEQPEDVVR
ncbi:Vacuolar import and degradation protein [Musa troglodytarum]|uniref:Vacuolar import and degradation protein n=1 Tax=Musa troglodytarum TaxID=320322 RepID=A0A9E7KTV7_9LILI|nr:Vacuolar import and degradation protein [Musa troglodytarum]URE27035.1 Vacuolar import and degradation protein [Musa troglodytarum]